MANTNFENLKLCSDCQWFFMRMDEAELCFLGFAQGQGKRFSEYQRSIEGLCGPEGKYWEIADDIP